MTTFSFELVSPERILFSGEVTRVIVPGAEGEMTVMAQHAPFMSALRSGVVIVDNDRKLYVRGGFADVSTSGLTLLAEYAIPVEEIDVEKQRQIISFAAEEMKIAKSDEERTAIKEKIDAAQDLLAASA